MNMWETTKNTFKSEEEVEEWEEKEEREEDGCEARNQKVSLWRHSAPSTDEWIMLRLIKNPSTYH